MPRVLSILLVTLVPLVTLSGCAGGGGGSASTSPPAAAPVSKAKAADRPAEKTSCEGGTIIVYYCGPEEFTPFPSRR